MHNNYFFLQQLTKSLEQLITGAVVSECFSQSKDELVVRFERKSSPFFIKASLSPSFSCLSFPDKFHRARKNSIDLFDELIGQRVEGIRLFRNERSFSIMFSNEFVLLFKMHGNRSNIIAFQSGVVNEVFKNNIPDDQILDMNSLDRDIDGSYENFLRNHTHPENIYFTFGKLVWKYLRVNHFDDLSIEEQWKAIQAVLHQLNQPKYSIRELNGKIFFSLLDFGSIIKQFEDPVEAINNFFIFYTQQAVFSREKMLIVSELKSRLQSTENYIAKTQMKLQQLEKENNYKVWADLLMANLHTVPAGAEYANLPDFYNHDRNIEIKLKRDLSPQKNAAIFYKKAKNQQIEIRHLQQLLRNKQEEREATSNQLKQVERAEDVKALRTAIGTRNVGQEKQKSATTLPYREVEFNGYKIWIGKNARSNDSLTLKYGYKEDLWLHAKDVAGSHVLIKYQSGKNFPKDVIERAAQLAAHHSKRKNESLCPVAITQKKYVRKRKGDPPGSVVVEREEVLMVEPMR